MEERARELSTRLEDAIAGGADAREVAAIAVQLGAETATATGECRVEPGDFKPLYPVLDKDGMRWECGHHPAHRTEVVAGLEP